MKRTLLLLLALAAALSSGAYSFSYTVPSGQTLYFTLTATDEVKVVSPVAGGWTGYTKPAGRLVIPPTVAAEGSTYRVTAIDSKAFQDCTSLTSVSVPGSVVSIGMRAFFRDAALTSATLAEGVERIEMMAFMQCTALDTISLPTTLTRVSVSAFENTAFYNDTANWNSDFSLILGQWVIKVGNLVQGKVTVPDGIVGIANSAFLYCHDMNYVDLPATLRYVGEGAFNACSGLDSVYLRASVPPSLSYDSFEGVEQPAVLRVPCGSAAAYEAAEYWNLFTVIDSCTVGIGEVPTAADIAVCQQLGGVEVTGAEGQSLVVVDLTGRTVCTVSRAMARQYLPLPVAGIYVLRTEKQTVKISYCSR